MAAYSTAVPPNFYKFVGSHLPLVEVMHALFHDEAMESGNMYSRVSHKTASLLESLYPKRVRIVISSSQKNTHVFSPMSPMGYDSLENGCLGLVHVPLPKTKWYTSKLNSHLHTFPLQTTISLSQ